MQARITSNVTTQAEKFDKNISDQIVKTINEGMRRALQVVGILSAQNFLQGPKPDHLRIDTGRLIRGMMGGHSFNEADTGRSVSNADSIREIKREHKSLVGVIGLKTFSPWDYPEYWEERGTVHGGPRPFLGPAEKAARSSGKIDQVIQEEIDKLRFDK